MLGTWQEFDIEDTEGLIIITCDVNHTPWNVIMLNHTGDHGYNAIQAGEFELQVVTLVNRTWNNMSTNNGTAGL